MKRICVLYGSPQGSHRDFTLFLEQLISSSGQDADFRVFKLHEMNIRSCMGCWSCWWKSPGLCAIKDDAEEIFRAMVHSDLVIYCSPVLTGFISSTLKMLIDRLIVLIHPYMEYHHRESHHRRRYDSYPATGVLLQPAADTDEEDLQIIENYFNRLVLNFHSRLVFCKSIYSIQASEIIHENHHLHRLPEG